jgi:hypothetical protein
MKFLLLLLDDDETSRRRPAEQDARMAQTRRWWDEHVKAGRILSGSQLQGPETATTVRHTGSGPIITDGPFIEAKETIGGYGLIEVADLDEALEMARTWPMGGTVEVRPVLARS